MNIAIINGGEESRRLWESLPRYPYPEDHPRLVAVVEEDETAWANMASEAGLFVAKDCRDLLKRDDIDTVIDLGGKGPCDDFRNRVCHIQILSGRKARSFLEMLRAFTLSEDLKRELEGLRIRYNAAINSFSHEDVLLISRNYDIIDINETMLKKMGLTRGEVMGKHCYELSHSRTTPCDGKEHPCPLKQCLEKREHSQTTHIHTDRRGGHLYFSISCYPVFENEEVVGAVEISKDITRDIRLEKNLFHREKMASIGQLAAGVAHEINNPLTTILTTAMLIQEEMEQEDPNFQDLRTIVNETLRCRKIVKSLLDFARQSKPSKAAQDINDVVRETIALTRKQAAFKDIEFDANLPEGLPNVYVDKDQIQQSLINLALNAIEASEPGEKIRFSTRLVPDKACIEISVSDTGSGIPERDLDTIFDPFFTTKESGTGLGLAITHGIIQRHGGTITVKSKEGHGTTFRIRLPLGMGDNDGR
ncbi:MAG: ATP-binding protein [Desulfobacterales bacterium]|nr:ATP-binding protein [Desulfobacterales bacterium]